MTYHHPPRLHNAPFLGFIICLFFISLCILRLPNLVAAAKKTPGPSARAFSGREVTRPPPSPPKRKPKSPPRIVVEEEEEYDDDEDEDEEDYEEEYEEEEEYDDEEEEEEEEEEELPPPPPPPPPPRVKSSKTMRPAPPPPPAKRKKASTTGVKRTRSQQEVAPPPVVAKKKKKTVHPLAPPPIPYHDQPHPHPHQYQQYPPHHNYQRPPPHYHMGPTPGNPPNPYPGAYTGNTNTSPKKMPMRHGHTEPPLKDIADVRDLAVDRPLNGHGKVVSQWYKAWGPMFSSGWEAGMALAKDKSKIILREAKGMLSSELEGVLVKATRPDDERVKEKHLQLLMAISYQTPPQFDPYYPVVRKLWAKMMEEDYRTKTKALFILHSFSAKGAVAQANNFKKKMVELTGQLDPKTKKRFFDQAVILEGDSNNPMTKGLHSFLDRYSTYTLFRATHFSPGFSELSKLIETPQDIPIKTGLPEAEMLLLNLDGLLARGVKALVEQEAEVSKLTAACVESVYEDLAEMLELVGHVINHLRQQQSAGPVSLPRARQLQSLYGRYLQAANEALERAGRLLAAHSVGLKHIEEISLVEPPQEDGKVVEEVEAPVVTEGSGSEPVITKANDDSSRQQTAKVKVKEKSRKNGNSGSGSGGSNQQRRKEEQEKRAPPSKPAKANAAKRRRPPQPPTKSSSSARGPPSRGSGSSGKR